MQRHSVFATCVAHKCKDTKELQMTQPDFDQSMAHHYHGHIQFIKYKVTLTLRWSPYSMLGMLTYLI